jgi:hypothetical protein
MLRIGKVVRIRLGVEVEEGIGRHKMMSLRMVKEWLLVGRVVGDGIL